MTTGSPYSRPPIVEAILDIQVDLPGDLSRGELLKCQRKVKKDYPNRTDTLDINLRGEMTGPRVSASATSEPTGYAFASPDAKQVFQVKQTGFTFNRLAPYTGWDDFSAEAKRLWEEYRRVTRPRGYKRLSLRYLDRFDIPSETVRMETYFRTYPEISRDLPQVMNGFFFQFNLPIEDIAAVATVTQTVVAPSQPGHSSFILDVDLYRTEALPPGNEMWPLFETLRLWKNKIFEACITDSIRELIR
jgi:uncharacterized protein (TIGR04255 family)